MVDREMRPERLLDYDREMIEALPAPPPLLPDDFEEFVKEINRRMRQSMSIPKRYLDMDECNYFRSRR